jgi:hypothetical protein
LTFSPGGLDFELSGLFSRIATESTVAKYIDRLWLLGLIEWKACLFSNGEEIWSLQETDERLCLLGSEHKAREVIRTVKDMELLDLPKGGFLVVVPMGGPDLTAYGLMRPTYLPQTAPVVEMRRKASKEEETRAA